MITPELAGAIAKQAKVALRPASQPALSQLRALGLPPSIVAFYEHLEPAAFAEIADVRLWPIKNVLEENQDYVPGADLHPHGFVVFATTLFGDAYCFDLNEPSVPVVLMSHELDFSEMPAERIKALRKRVATDFDDFLEQFAAGRLDREPLFEPQP